MVALSSSTFFENPHSRARSIARRCTDSLRCKSLDRIEMRYSIYESRVGLESFSRDPIKYQGSQWNLYEFVEGRALVGRDPSGLAPGGVVQGCRKKKPNPCKGFDRDKLFADFPKFKSLIDCAVRQNCLAGPDRVICKPDCTKDQIGGYVFPSGFFRAYIYICPNELNNRGIVSTLNSTLLEEAYHALTICYGGNKLGGSLGELKDKMRDAGLSASLQSCGDCIGREILAKACARNLGNVPLPGVVLSDALTSCRECDPDFNNSPINYPNAPLGSVLIDWWNSGSPQRDCTNIDSTCGAN